MSQRNWLPSVHPMSGIRPWNPPKNNASTTATFKSTFFMPRPLQMDTANASIESPTAMSSSSAMPMILLSRGDFPIAALLHLWSS